MNNPLSMISINKKFLNIRRFSKYKFYERKRSAFAFNAIRKTKPIRLTRNYGRVLKLILKSRRKLIPISLLKSYTTDKIGLYDFTYYRNMEKDVYEFEECEDNNENVEFFNGHKLEINS